MPLCPSPARRALLLGLLLPVAAAAQPPSRDMLAVDAAQQVALGVRLAPVRVATSAALELPARAVVPAGAQALVAAPAPGVVTQVRAASGERVRRGQLLGEMRSTEVAQLQRERDDARVQFDLARQQSQRDGQLLRDGIIAQSRAQASAAREQQASLLLRERELALRLQGAGPGLDGGVRLLAPIDGVVVQAQALPGQRVDTAQTLFQLAAQDQLMLEIDASAEQAAALRAGAQVEVSAAGASAVLLAPPPVLAAGQTVALRARITRAGTLHAGQLLQARVQLPARKGLFSVPPSALTQLGGHDAVLVSTSGGFRIVRVQLVSRLPDELMVSGALRDGEQVAASGVVALKAMVSNAAAGDKP